MDVTLWRLGETVTFPLGELAPLLAAIAFAGGPVLELHDDGIWYEDDIATEAADALWLWREHVAHAWGDSWLGDANWLSWWLGRGGFGIRPSAALLPALEAA